MSLEAVGLEMFPSNCPAERGLLAVRAKVAASRGICESEKPEQYEEIDQKLAALRKFKATNGCATLAENIPPAETEVPTHAIEVTPFMRLCSVYVALGNTEAK